MEGYLKENIQNRTENAGLLKPLKQPLHTALDQSPDLSPCNNYRNENQIEGSQLWHIRGDPASVTEAQVQENKVGLPLGDLKKKKASLLKIVQMCTRRWLFKGDQTNLQQVKVFYIMELLSAPLKKIPPHLYDSKQGKKKILFKIKKRNGMHYYQDVGRKRKTFASLAFPPLRCPWQNHQHPSCKAARKSGM